MLEKTGIIQHRFENWFLNQLNIHLASSPKKSEIYYWRTSGQVEVDFILHQPPFLIPFEVTYAKTVQKKKIKHLKAFLQNEPKASHGFLIYNGPYQYDAESNIHCIPAWMIYAESHST